MRGFFCFDSNKFTSFPEKSQRGGFSVRRLLKSGLRAACCCSIWLKFLLAPYFQILLLNFFHAKIFRSFCQKVTFLLSAQKRDQSYIPVVSKSRAWTMGLLKINIPTRALERKMKRMTNLNTITQELHFLPFFILKRGCHNLWIGTEFLRILLAKNLISKFLVLLSKLKLLTTGFYLGGIGEAVKKAFGKSKFISRSRETVSFNMRLQKWPYGAK